MKIQNTVPQIYEKVKKENLKQNQYTLSLIQEGFRTGLLDINDIGSIEVQIMNILKDLILRYTKGESTSVAVHTAESLLNSVLYTLDMYHLSIKNPEEAIIHLKKSSIKILYDQGVEILCKTFEETKEIFKNVRKTSLNTRNEAYTATILEAIPNFFQKYGIIFDSHNEAASIDYPLALDDTSVRGLRYIKCYLENLLTENRFCSFFNVEDIENTLKDFCEINRMDYRIELINIFEVVFTNAVFSYMSGNVIVFLSILESEFELLNEKLLSMDHSDIEKAIRNSVEGIVNTFNIEDYTILSYIGRYMESFVKRVINAVEGKSLSKFVVIKRADIKKENTILLNAGDRISDKIFRLIVKKINKITNINDKIELIRTSIFAFQDFVDLLESDCLFGEEFKALFHILSDVELAFLAKVIFYEELRDGDKSLKLLIFSWKEMQREWQGYFMEFLQGLDSGRIDSIEEHFGEIFYEGVDLY
ncbi:MAG TPA: DUF6179 domain-containing protein [Clostridia bacterium]